MNSQNLQPGNQESYQRIDENGKPQIVYMSRPMEPHRQQVSEEARKRHEDSKRQYPRLNISDGEYVISAIKRHPVGLFGIWFSVVAVVMCLVALVLLLSSFADSSDYAMTSVPIAYLVIPVVLLSMLAVLFGFVSTVVYNANRFYLTNESVIQHIQTSLFSKREQTISLANIEDASYAQNGIVQHMLNYGLLRLSTEGDETTYRFNYAGQPEKQIALLNNAVENFKNVRPIE